jgi:hypothetical protein
VRVITSTPVTPVTPVDPWMGADEPSHAVLRPTSAFHAGARGPSPANLEPVVAPRRDRPRNWLFWLVMMLAVVLAAGAAALVSILNLPDAIKVAYVSPRSGATLERCGNVFKVRGDVPNGSVLVQSVQRHGSKSISFKAGFSPDAKDQTINALPMYVGDANNDSAQVFTVRLYVADENVVKSWDEKGGYWRIATEGRPPQGLTAVPGASLELTRKSGPANCTT